MVRPVCLRIICFKRTSYNVSLWRRAYAWKVRLSKRFLYQQYTNVFYISILYFYISTLLTQHTTFISLSICSRSCASYTAHLRTYVNYGNNCTNLDYTNSSLFLNKLTFYSSWYIRSSNHEILFILFSCDFVSLIPYSQNTQSTRCPTRYRYLWCLCRPIFGRSHFGRKRFIASNL